MINEYNHNMNGVDRANQLRASMSISRPREHRVWVPMWQFCFEISTVNAFLCWRFGRSSKHRLHRTFRLELINALLDYPLESEAIGRVPEDINSWPGHQWSKFLTRNYCKWCRMTLRARCRAPLTEVVNGVHPRARARGRMTLGGCQKCNVYLCSSGICFRQFHSFKS